MSAAPLPRSGALRLSDLDFELPAELVAQRPPAVRDGCRLLCVRREQPGGFVERRFHDLPALLRPGDIIVRNVSKVLPARLGVVKEGSGAPGELLLLEPAAAGDWWALVRPGRRLRAGVTVHLQDGTRLVLTAVREDGARLVSPPPGVDVAECAHRLGSMPLPPYIRRPAETTDRDDYQTVYARVEGSVAAPTAGLHFTSGLLAALAAAGVQTADLVLHVGPGTFRPIREFDPERHPMHWERFAMDAAEWERLSAARRAGGRVIAVGTTVVRTLESIAAHLAGTHSDAIEMEHAAGVLSGRSRLFIRPPHGFTTIDALVTNFHLPRSTLLLLVDAFAGRAAIRAAYAHAVRERFQFFSYGDAMWIE